MLDATGHVPCMEVFDRLGDNISGPSLAYDKKMIEKEIFVKFDQKKALPLRYNQQCPPHWYTVVPMGL
jgi:hypothetical protein